MITILIESSSKNFLEQNPRLQKFKKSSINKNFLQKLFHYFLLNESDELPVAAVSALAENYPGAEGWWVRADPVHLQADMSHVYLLGNKHFDFSQEEIDELLAELNKFLKEDNLQLLAPKKTTWYLQLNHDPEIKTFPLEEVTGKIITNYLPQGQNSVYWQKLLTEIQMLLSMNNINKRRRAENKPIINSVWFWGSGKLPTITKKPQWHKIFGSDQLTKGLALLTGIHYEDLDKNILSEIKNSEEYLVVINHDEVGRLDSLLKEFTRTRSTIILDFADESLFEFNSKQLCSWWQRIF